MAEVVSFINLKDRVGKTTLCVETAASLVGRFGAKVLLIDLDPQHERNALADARG